MTSGGGHGLGGALGHGASVTSRASCFEAEARGIGAICGRAFARALARAFARRILLRFGCLALTAIALLANGKTVLTIAGIPATYATTQQRSHSHHRTSFPPTQRHTMADDTLAVNLKVLSPSSEIEGGLHLQQLPASTTVRELRLKIQDAVASKPGPERMRLIYRGKVVANDADTLETVFGADNVRGPALVVAWQLAANEAPAPRLQRPEPASGPARTAAALFDVVHPSSTHSNRDGPAESIPLHPSPSAREPSTPDEPLPSHPTAPTKLAPSTRTAPPPPPPPCAPPTCPSPPPCTPTSPPSGSQGRRAASTTDAAADSASTRPAWPFEPPTSSRHANTASRRSCV